MQRSIAGLALALLFAAPVARADYIDHFAATDDVGLLKIPHEGETRVLVLPVIVDDLPFDQGNEAAFLEELQAFYAPDATGWAFTPYWVTQSLGRYRPLATIASPVRVPTCPPLGAYSDCAIPRGAGITEGDLQGAIATLRSSLVFLDQILQCAQNGPGASLPCTEGGGVVLADFDTSGAVAGTPDGFVDGVILVSNAGFPGIALPVKEFSENDVFTLFGSLPGFTYGGITVPSIAISGSTRAPQHTPWLSVHEFGHLLGFADLYDETGRTTDMPYTLMGGWFYGTAAPLLDPFSRIAIGFGHVVQVAGDGVFTLKPSDESGTVLKVGTGDEFFLVELRRKVVGAHDEDLEVEAGVLVERVRFDERPSPSRGDYLETLQECVNCKIFDSFLGIEQADGLFQLEFGRGVDDAGDLFQAGDEIGPSDDTAPRTTAHAVFSTNLLDGTPTGITIRVTAASPEEATVEITSPPVADPCVEIAPYCGALECVDGECGSVLPDEPPPQCEGCCCASSSRLSSVAGTPLPGVFGAVALAALVRASRRRARA